ncbi:MAG: TMEM175 family protein [Bryobacteraceae bacterium]|jgi:uncharacterized membrane protein
MAFGRRSTERLAAFSDGVIAIIITIMVLELKAPRDASMAALLELWPVFVSYALSYLFVGIVWVNHHHLLRHVEDASPLVIWANLAFLFFVFFQKAIATQFGDNTELKNMDRVATRRNWIALVLYALAIPAAWLHPAVSLGIIVGTGVLYFIPDARKRT